MDTQNLRHLSVAGVFRPATVAGSEKQGGKLLRFPPCFFKFNRLNSPLSPVGALLIIQVRTSADRSCFGFRPLQ